MSPSRLEERYRGPVLGVISEHKASHFTALGSRATSISQYIHIQTSCSRRVCSCALYQMLLWWCWWGGGLFLGPFTLLSSCIFIRHAAAEGLKSHVWYNLTNCNPVGFCWKVCVTGSVRVCCPFLVSRFLSFVLFAPLCLS